MMSKYCEQCGTELEDNAMFCPECGTKCHSENVEVKERSKENKSKKKMVNPKIILFFAAD